MRRYLPLLVLVLAAASLVAPSIADAYTTTGKRWPGRTITYRSTMPRGFDSSLAQAARTWNSAGARIRFVKARRGARAQVTISYGATPGAAGYASIGYQRNAYVHINRGARPPRTAEDRRVMVLLFTHELGHVLGLNHSEKTNCEIMHPHAGSASGCRLPAAPDPGYYQCRILFPDDVRGLVRLYGGRARISRIYCLMQPAPRQLNRVVFSGGAPTASPLTISWQRPTGFRSGAQIEVSVWDSGRCNAEETWQYRRSIVKLPPTATSWTDPDEVIEPTRVCVQVQILNRFQHGAPPIRREMTTALEVPTAPAVAIGAEFPDEYADYLVTTSAGTQLQVMRGEPGACPTALDAERALGASPLDETTWTIENVPAGGSCLSFFALSGAGVPSPPTMIEVTHAVRPMA
jgi:hypothetical protein